MVIFIKPKDIPSVVNFLVKIWKKIQSFVSTIRTQIQNITSEISDTTGDIEETFHDKIEQLRLEINNETDLFDKSPKLNLEQQKKNKNAK
ncbi:MAG: hypothetical protein K6F04_02145 [bacterium]|nr:hypothetical protein [bacterium]